MIEAYAFLGMLAVQIVAGSVIFPARVITRVRRWAQEYGSERFVQQYPQADVARWVARFAAIFRAANMVIMLLGVALLGWLYTLTQKPDWAGEVKMPLVGYVFAQLAPVAFLALYGVVRGFKLLFQASQEARRTATLQRRGLFDFVSPFAIGIAVLSYVGSGAFSIYLDLVVYGNASLSRQCYIAIGTVSAIYALNAFVVYKYLYGRKNPLMSHEGRVHSISVNVKGAVYGSTVAAWFLALVGVVSQPHLKEWTPFALTLFFAVTWLIMLMSVSPPPRMAAQPR